MSVESVQVQTVHVLLLACALMYLEDKCSLDTLCLAQNLSSTCLCRMCIMKPMCCLQVRDQLTHLEDNVPWNAVKSAWRNRRPGWRRQLKAADSIAEVATRMEEFRQHLANDGPALVVQLFQPNLMAREHPCTLRVQMYASCFTFSEMRSTSLLLLIG